jgi:membrane protein
MGWLEAHGIQSQSSMAIEKVRRLLMATITKWWNDNPWRLSAALSFYTLLSLAPLLTIAVGIAAVVADEEAVHKELLGQFEALMGTTGTEAMANILHSANHPQYGTIATLVSFVTLLFVSMGVFNELQDALNLIWRIQTKSSSVFWQALRTQLVSFMLVLGTGFLLLASLILSILLSTLGTVIQRAVPWLQIILTVVELTAFPIVIILLFALIFKILPQAHITWRDVWLGAVATAVPFTLGKWAIGFYVGRVAMASMYGAASSPMVILVWVYYSALIFFLGAEFTYVYAYEFGSRRTHR